MQKNPNQACLNIRPVQNMEKPASQEILQYKRHKQMTPIKTMN